MIGFPIHPDVLERLKRMGERKLIVRHVRDPFAKVATDADLGRPDRREAIAREPDIDICSECKEHAEFEETDDGMVSNCCGASAYCTDFDWDMER